MECGVSDKILLINCESVQIGLVFDTSYIFNFSM